MTLRKTPYICTGCNNGVQYRFNGHLYYHKTRCAADRHHPYPYVVELNPKGLAASVLLCTLPE